LCPQQTCDQTVLIEAAETVALYCYTQGIFGVLTVDFVAWDDVRTVSFESYWTNFKFADSLEGNKKSVVYQH
jgi:hypothetical protein